jgi:carboxylesterase type B
VVLNHSHWVFRGIPYAVPPTRENGLRFKPPEELKGPWEKSPLRAQTKTIGCFGARPQCPLAHESEDCLTLQIFTPRNVNASFKLPVYFYIHGGDYTTGCADDSEPIIKDAISVTLNYRLGVFGFLGSDAMRRLTPDGHTGQMGIEDQQMALRWVQRHISAFGGDPMKVTIGGQSSGGNAVLHHLVRPASDSLYSKAIVQSNNYMSSVSLDVANIAYNAILQIHGCPQKGEWIGDSGGLECLLNLDAKELFSGVAAAIQPTGHIWHELWGPVIDGVSHKARIPDLIAQGHFKRVPTIFGSMADDGQFGLEVWPVHACPDKLKKDDLAVCLAHLEIEQMLPGWKGDPHQFEQVLKIYSPTRYEYPADLGNRSLAYWTALRIATDVHLGPCTTRRIARLMAQAKPRAPLYTYLWSRPFSCHELKNYTDRAACRIREGKAFHGFDIAWMMAGGIGSKALQHATFLDWVSYFRSFIHDEHGNPNAHYIDTYIDTLPVWPQFKIESDRSLVFKGLNSGGPEVQQNVRKEACDFWDSLASVAAPASGNRNQHVL